MAQAKKASKAPSTEDLAEQISQIKDDISALTKMMGDYAADAEDRAQSAFNDTARAAKARGRKAAQDAQAHAEQWGAQANDFILEKPGTALAIAAGLGFLVGALGSRR